MWRVAARFIVFACGLSLAACVPDLPALLSSTPLPSSSSPLALSPSASASPAPLPTLITDSAPTIIVDASGTFTPIPTFTSTNGPGTLAATVLMPTLPPLTATVVESVSLDKLPPGTVYKPVRIENLSRSEMDISLHCTTLRGLQTVLEYEGVKRLTVQAPDGNYVYVVYVGGRKIVGSFSILDVPNLTITVYADRVAIH